MSVKFWDELTQEQKIERWENVARVLKNLSPHEKRRHFDMGLWGAITDCGTVACAAGHCGLDPWFRRRGLKLVFKSRGLHARGFLSTPPDLFFGQEGTDHIFYNTYPRSVTQVIKEVKEFVKELKKEAPAVVSSLQAQ